MSEKHYTPFDVKPWSGFIHILCPWCGTESTFCLRDHKTELVCRACDRPMDLPRGTKVYINCECGFDFRYRTNRVDDMFEIPCVKCGTPNPVVYHHAKRSYLPADWMPKHLKGKK